VNCAPICNDGFTYEQMGLLETRTGKKTQGGAETRTGHNWGAAGSGSQGAASESAAGSGRLRGCGR
jgi:hypothetical protein